MPERERNIENERERGGKMKRDSKNTVCPGSSDPPGKIFNIFASENEVYPIY